MDIEQVNALDYEEFIKIFGNVIEHAAICAAAVWRHRPFRDVQHLHHEICSFLLQLPMTGKEAILRLHPDLAGRLAEQKSLTQESTDEQKAAGLDTLSTEEKHFLKESNEKYKEKFGFPFVICARHNKKDAILKGIADRLDNSHEQELDTGIEEVKKICLLRILNIVNEPEKSHL